jgi:hypothetical protein
VSIKIAVKEIKFELDEIENLKEELSDYLAFRHLYRHSYSSHLKWREMEYLVTSIHRTWIKFRSEISLFIKALESKE